MIHDNQPDFRHAAIIALGGFNRDSSNDGPANIDDDLLIDLTRATFATGGAPAASPLPLPRSEGDDLTVRPPADLDELPL